MKVAATLLGPTATSLVKDKAFKRTLSRCWGGDRGGKPIRRGFGSRL